MVRTQIQLPSSQAERLRQLAARRGVSMAECVRDSLAQYLVTADAEAEKTSIDEALAVCGKHRSGLRDLAARHDDYLAEDDKP